MPLTNAVPAHARQLSYAERFWDTPWSTDYRGSTLDLSGYTLAFADDFDDIGTITAHDGAGPWYTGRLANNGSAGLCRFIEVGDGASPYSCANSILSITASYSGTEWRSGLIELVSSSGVGQAWIYGYFEWKLAGPTGDTKGSWIAAWMRGQNRNTGATIPVGCEIDVVEAYAVDASNSTKTHSSRHLWPGTNLETHASESKILDTGTDLFSGSFHTYGCMLGVVWAIIYFDGFELCRFRRGDYQTPLYPLLDLDILSTTASPSGPLALQCDYVKVWVPVTA